MNNKYADVCELNNNTRRIILYGAGEYGTRLFLIYEQFGIHVDAFVDQEEKGKAFMNIPVLKPEELLANDYIVITPIKENVKKSIERWLDERGFKYYFPDCEYECVESLTELFGRRVDLTIEELEKKSKKIIREKNSLKIYKFWSSRIGEYIYRFWCAYLELRNNDCYMCIPTCKGTKKIANERLHTILSRYINIVTRENADIWKFMLAFHFSEFDSTELEHFEEMQSDFSMQDISEKDMPSINFNKKEMDEVNAKLYKYGIVGKYVCVFARDGQYLGNEDVARNSDISMFTGIADYLQKKNIKVIRMGSAPEKEWSHPNVIDFAAIGYDELLDLYLCANCLCYLGGVSGAVFIPRLFKKKLLLVDIDGFITSCFQMNNSYQAIYIYKLYYDNEKKRYMNIEEMLMINLISGVNEKSNYLKMFGIRIESNSQDDVLELYKEAELRFQNKWIDDSKGVYLQKRYRMIIDNFIKKYGNMSFYSQTKYKIRDCLYKNSIATTFLIRHPFLVEEINLD